MSNPLIDVSNELAQITEALDSHVVAIHARRRYSSSGLRFGPDLIVTADHALHRDEEIKITSAGCRSTGASLLGRDPGSDLAVLRLNQADANPLPERLQAAKVKAGELALVVGRSVDSGLNASLGIVSAVSGPWRTWRGGRLDSYIRLDATLFPQSAGGAVVNARGELIGIATPALSRIAGLAIPASTVRHITGLLVEKGFVPRGYLGVGVQPVPISDDVQRKLSLTNRIGLIVLTIESGGPADKAGLLVGDILLAAGDVTLDRPEVLREYSESASIGSPVKLRLIRGGAIAESVLVIGERPAVRR